MLVASQRRGAKKFSLIDSTLSQIQVLGHKEQIQGSSPDVTDPQGYENDSLWSYRRAQWGEGAVGCLHY